MKSPQSKLLNSFIALVADIGAHRVTLQMVAKRARVPFSTAHYYYGGDWDRIFQDAVGKVGTDAQTFIAAYLETQNGSGNDPVEVYVNGTFEWIRERRKDARLWLFNYYYSSLKEKFTQEQARFIEVARGRVLCLLYEAKGRGLYPDVTVSMEHATRIHTIVFGLGILAIIQNFDESKTRELNAEALHQVRTALSLRNRVS